MFAALCLALTFSSQAPADVATWAQWRGPTRDGIVTSQSPWPETISEKNLTKVWQINDLGPSYSGPIVSEDRIFTTETVNKKQEVVTAYDRKTGKKLWQQSWEGSLDVPFFAARNGSWIRSTPAYDQGKLYVGGIRDLMVCLDASTGKILWQLDFMKEMNSPLPTFGFVCSPLVDETGVYVQAGSAFAKVDKKTGKIIWYALKDTGGMMGSAFSSPVFAKLDGQDQVVVQTRTTLAGVSRGTGTVLWKKEIPSFRGMNILTPVPFGTNSVFTSTYGGTTQLLRIKGEGEQQSAENGWAFKYEGNMTSPVIIDNFAYFLGKDQRVICVDLATGKEAWRSEKRFGQYWSMVASGDKILALDQRGILYLMKANPKEFEVLAERKVADAESWAHLAICGSEIVIRDLNSLTVWNWSEVKP